MQAREMRIYEMSYADAHKQEAHGAGGIMSTKPLATQVLVVTADAREGYACTEEVVAWPSSTVLSFERTVPVTREAYTDCEGLQLWMRQSLRSLSEVSQCRRLNTQYVVHEPVTGERFDRALEGGSVGVLKIYDHTRLDGAVDMRVVYTYGDNNARFWVAAKTADGMPWMVNVEGDCSLQSIFARGRWTNKDNADGTQVRMFVRADLKNQAQGLASKCKIALGSGNVPDEIKEDMRKFAHFFEALMQCNEIHMPLDARVGCAFRNNCEFECDDKGRAAYAYKCVEQEGRIVRKPYTESMAAEYLLAQSGAIISDVLLRHCPTLVAHSSESALSVWEESLLFLDRTLGNEAMSRSVMECARAVGGKLLIHSDVVKGAESRGWVAVGPESPLEIEMSALRGDYVVADTNRSECELLHIGLTRNSRRHDPDKYAPFENEYMACCVGAAMRIPCRLDRLRFAFCDAQKEAERDMATAARLLRSPDLARWGTPEMKEPGVVDRLYSRVHGVKSNTLNITTGHGGEHYAAQCIGDKCELEELAVGNSRISAVLMCDTYRGAMRKENEIIGLLGMHHEHHKVYLKVGWCVQRFALEVSGMECDAPGYGAHYDEIVGALSNNEACDYYDVRERFNIDNIQPGAAVREKSTQLGYKGVGAVDAHRVISKYNKYHNPDKKAERNSAYQATCDRVKRGAHRGDNAGRQLPRQHVRA